MTQTDGFCVKTMCVLRVSCRGFGFGFLGYGFGLFVEELLAELAV